MTPELPLHIDSTMISAARSCLQKFRKEFILGLRPSLLSVDLHAGACFASALENIYTHIHFHSRPLDIALQYAFKQYLVDWGDFVPMKDTPKTCDNVWAAVEDYFAHYPPLTDPVQPYLSDGRPTMEFTFAIPLEPDEGFPLHPSGSPFLYSGRFDMLGTMHGRPVVRDEKTTKSIASNWAEQWDLRSQFIGYTWACQQSGIDLDTVVVRGVGILKTKFHQVEAIKQYSSFLVSRWYEQLRRDLWRIRRAYDEGYFDFNLADACTSYGGCPFHSLCSSPNEERWYGNYERRIWNPLQKNPISPLGTPSSLESPSSSPAASPSPLTSFA